ERAVAREQIARRHAEGHEVARPVEAIDEAGEGGGVARRIELADEGGRRRSHHGERALERAAEEVDAAVGQARREQRDDLAIGGAGLGAIGRQVCRAIDAGLPGLALAGATARTRDRAESFLATLKSRPAFLDVDALVEASDLVVEASTQAHLVELAPKVLAAG